MGFPNKKKARRPPKNRKTKKTVVFDEQARTEYLTGFRKRKDQRRKKAQIEHELRKKEEKKELKKQLKELKERRVKCQRTVPEVEHLVDPETFELPDHTVTVTDISNIDLSGSSGLHLGQNKFREEEEEEEGENPSPNKYANASEKKLKKMKSKIIKKISKSDAHKTKRLSNKSRHGKRTKSKKEKHRDKVRKRR